MKIIDDTLKSRGKWSAGKLTMVVAFLANVAYAGFSTYKSGTLPDLPTNWLALIVGMYGVNKAGQVTMTGKAPSEQA